MRVRIGITALLLAAAGSVIGSRTVFAGPVAWLCGHTGVGAVIDPEKYCPDPEVPTLPRLPL